jgi:hypothetical protein
MQRVNGDMGRNGVWSGRHCLFCSLLRVQQKLHNTSKYLAGGLLRNRVIFCNSSSSMYLLYDQHQNLLVIEFFFICYVMIMFMLLIPVSVH